MNPHDILLSEHQALRTQAATLRAAIEKDVTELTQHLGEFQKTVQKHFQHEETYYRILDDGKRLEDRGFVHQLRNDHAAVIFTLESLAIRLRKNGVNPDWRTRFDTLMNVFLPHLDQEEKHLFPDGMKILTPKELATILEHIQSCE